MGNLLQGFPTNVVADGGTNPRAQGLDDVAVR